MQQTLEEESTPLQVEADPASNFCQPQSPIYSAVKIGVIVTSSLAIICGIATIIQLTVLCAFSGLFTILIAVAIIGLDAPPRWQYFRSLQWFFQDRPKWHKGAMYGMLGLLPLLMCRSIPSIIGFSLLLIGGVACAVVDTVFDRLSRQKEEVAMDAMTQAAAAAPTMVDTSGTDANFY